jgi:hypothetical protein
MKTNKKELSTERPILLDQEPEIINENNILENVLPKMTTIRAPSKLVADLKLLKKIDEEPLHKVILRFLPKKAK